jgi:AcrR family transcriptional regulator
MKIHLVKWLKMPADEQRQGLERLLDTAENLFIEKGYSAIKLKHIAEKMGVRESSIYYHFPKGKEALFVAVMKRTFARHQHGIQEALRQSSDDWVAQLLAIATWLLSQPPLDVMRMSASDLPAIDAQVATEIEETIYESVNLPIRHILENAVAQNRAQIADCDLIAGVFVSMIASLDVIKGDWNPRSKTEMAEILIHSWVQGLGKR